MSQTESASAVAAESSQDDKEEYATRGIDSTAHSLESSRVSRNKDLREIANQAKDYVRRNPEEVILISAAVGLIVGYLFARLPGNPTTLPPPPRRRPTLAPVTPPRGGNRENE